MNRENLLKSIRLWFTSDWHLSHRTMEDIRKIKGSHDNTILRSVNNEINEEDVLYNLGDFSPRNKAEYLADLIHRVKCKTIHFIRGNHDKKLPEAIRIHQEKYGDKTLTLQDVLEVRHDVQGRSYKIWLSHYAHMSYPSSHKGALHFYGHSHSLGEVAWNKLFPDRNSMDVGIDNAKRLYGKFRPFSFEDTLTAIEAKK